MRPSTTIIIAAAFVSTSAGIQDRLLLLVCNFLLLLRAPFLSAVCLTHCLGASGHTKTWVQRNSESDAAWVWKHSPERDVLFPRYGSRFLLRMLSCIYPFHCSRDFPSTRATYRTAADAAQHSELWSYQPGVTPFLHIESAARFFYRPSQFCPVRSRFPYQL
jgi:hypothetical protein